MSTDLTSLLLSLLVVSSAMMSGLFFVFSNFAMRALAKLEAQAGIAAMQGINITIINPWFLAAFFGTAVGSLGVTILALAHWQHTASVWAISGGILYLGGGFLITALRNVPLNNRLAEVDPTTAAGAAMWDLYIARWLPWNHLRTITTLLAAAAYLMAIVNLR